MGPKSKLPSKCYEDKLEEIKSKRDIDKSEFIIKHMILSNKVDDKLEYEIIDGYEFDKVENNKIILKPIKPKYPTTYVECEKILGLEGSIIEGCLGYEYKRLNAFQKLLMCRDAYWKIAGEEMGLGKPWEPDWKHLNRKFYCIYNSKNNIVKNVTYGENKILAFPSEEMRDAFCENFKKEIEQCKELL